MEQKLKQFLSSAGKNGASKSKEPGMKSDKPTRKSPSSSQGKKLKRDKSGLSNHHEFGLAKDASRKKLAQKDSEVFSSPQRLHRVIDRSRSITKSAPRDIHTKNSVSTSNLSQGRKSSQRIFKS